MSDDQAPVPPSDPTPNALGQAPVPSIGGFLFAAVFGAAMVFNLIWDAMHADYGGEKITMFLGTATLLILGVDVGRIIGRK